MSQKQNKIEILSQNWMEPISMNLLRQITYHLKKLILSYPNHWLNKLKIQFSDINIFLNKLTLIGF